MASVESWLQKLGNPPQQICLDWAWQLTKLQSEVQPLADLHPVDTVALGWRDLELAADGTLKLITPGRRFDTTTLVQLLVHELERTDSATAAEPLLLTPACDPRTVAELLPRLASLTNAAPAFQPSKTKLTLATPPTVGQAIGSVTRTKLTSKSGRPIPTRTRVLAALAAGALLLAILWNWLQQTAGHQLASASLPQETDFSQSSVDQAAGTLQTHAESPAAYLQSLDNLISDENPTSATNDSQESSLGNVNLGTIMARYPSTASGAVSTQSASSQTPNTDTDADSSATANSAAEISIDVRTDLMQEVAELTTASEKQEREIEVGEPTGPQPDATDQIYHEPLLLSTWPMHQTQKLPSRLNPRPKQPVWHLALIVDEGFRVIPEEAQVITDRKTASWTVVSAEDQSPVTRMLIQVQLRQSNLRWQIASSPEDWPQLLLPVDEQRLPAVQDRLRQFRQMGTVESARLKQSVSTAPRELKSSLSQQRSVLERQLEIAGRLLETVSDTLLLNDRLHGQVAVHAALYDSERPNAAKLLQFGHPNANAAR